MAKRGEFGWLSDEKVDEIVGIIADFPITLEQALSLRAAINQEKSVYSHHRIMDRKKDLKRRYDNGTDILELATTENTISSVVEKQSSYQDLKYSVSKLPEYSSFAIKIVMTGVDPSYVPKIQDIRAVAAF